MKKNWIQIDCENKGYFKAQNANEIKRNKNNLLLSPGLSASNYVASNRG